MAYDYNMGHQYSMGKYQWALLTPESGADSGYATPGQPATGPATCQKYNGYETSNWNIPSGGYGPATFTWDGGIFVALAGAQITYDGSTQPLHVYSETDRVYLAYVSST